MTKSIYTYQLVQDFFHQQYCHPHTNSSPFVDDDGGPKKAATPNRAPHATVLLRNNTSKLPNLPK